jgi:hypothetical protein
MYAKRTNNLAASVFAKPLKVTDINKYISLRCKIQYAVSTFMVQETLVSLRQVYFSFFYFKGFCLPDTKFSSGFKMTEDYDSYQDTHYTAEIR